MSQQSVRVRRVHRRSEQVSVSAGGMWALKDALQFTERKIEFRSHFEKTNAFTCWLRKCDGIWIGCKIGVKRIYAQMTEGFGDRCIIVADGNDEGKGVFGG